MQIEQQYPIHSPDHDPSENVQARWRVYEHIDDPVDSIRFTHSFLLANRLLERDATVLDVGCNDGRDLIRLLQFGQQGLMYGIDPAIDREHPNFRDYGSKRETGSGIIPIKAAIEDLDPRKYKGRRHSIDLLMAHYMLYHTADPESVLQIFGELVKPEGVVVISTSGETNKQKHRFFEKVIAEALGVKQPPNVIERFTAEIADEMLPKTFGTVAVKHITGPARFDEAALPDYVASLASMYTLFDPPLPRPDSKKDNDPFYAAYEQYVEPLIRESMEESGGVFLEDVDRRIYICINSGLFDDVNSFNVSYL